MSNGARSTTGVVAIAAGAVAAVATLSAGLCTAEAEGVRWQEGPVDAALEGARSEGKRVFVEFSADWCPTCKQLEAEVLSTPAGAEVTEGMIAARVDFDAPASRPLVERYVILGLPTVLVLGPDGTQLGRIMGYEGRDQWLAEARAARTSDDPVPALRKLHEANPDSSAAALQLGKALLVRGSPADGEALLEQVSWNRSGREADLAAQALFLLGRYHHRVKQDPAEARHIWRELGTRFPDSEPASGAWWWYARAQAELDRPEVGFAALEAQASASPESLDAAMQVGAFVAKHGLKGHAAEARESLARLSKRATDDEERQEVTELLEKLAP